MKLCGLTGGVGMGKSTAAGFFSQLGARMIDTDDLAHELVQPGQPALVEIQNEFGAGMIDGRGRLKRGDLARLVFAHPDARKKLEDILHPRIRGRWQAQVESWRNDNCHVAMVVIPLLFETGAEANFDQIICVACSPAGQYVRLQSRGWSAEQIRGRIAAQLPADQKIARSHAVIWTEGSLDAHRRQIDEVFRKF